MFRKKNFHEFAVKGLAHVGKIELVRDVHQINAEEAQFILIESFIGEYEKYLLPHEIGEGLNSWREGEGAVTKYYERYFKAELERFSQGKMHYWVQATINGKLVGWATFQRENSDTVYMDLLVVHPEYQHKGIGAQLVHSLIHLNEIPNLSTIHLLLRKKNEGGRVFYSRLGFYSDPEYKRADNFVEPVFLEGWTWTNPRLHNEIKNGTHEPNKQPDSYSTMHRSVEAKPIPHDNKPWKNPVKRSKFLTFSLFAVAGFIVSQIITKSGSTPRPST